MVRALLCLQENIGHKSPERMVDSFVASHSKTSRRHETPRGKICWSMRVFLDLVFGWLVFGFAVPIFIGAGFTLLADDFRKFKAARICFCFAAVWIYGKVLMWSVLATDSFAIRATVVFLVFGIVGIGLSEVLRLTTARETAAKPATHIDSQPRLPTAAEIAEEIRKAKEEESPLRSDLQLLFFGRDSLLFNYINRSKESAQQPKYWFIVLDLSRPYFPPGSSEPNGLPVLTHVQGDFVRPGDMQGNVEVLNTPMAKNHVKSGDKLWMAAFVTCANCVTTRAYYVYFQVGSGGWYAEAPDAKKMEFPKPLNQPATDAAIESYADQLVPRARRIPIPVRLS